MLKLLLSYFISSRGLHKNCACFPHLLDFSKAWSTVTAIFMPLWWVKQDDNSFNNTEARLHSIPYTNTCMYNQAYVHDVKLHIIKFTYQLVFSSLLSFLSLRLFVHH